MLLLCLVVLVASVAAQKHNPCCGATQFECLMERFGEAYNPSTQDVTLVDETIQTYYDYDNKQMAQKHHMMNLDGSSRDFKIVLDYTRLKMFVISDGNNCTEMDMGNLEMPGPCIPHNATYTSTAVMGYGQDTVKFETWVYDVADTALSVTLDVAPNGCIPVLQTVQGTDKGDKEAMSYSFTNYVLGIDDRSIFHVPFNCPRSASTLPSPVGRALEAFNKFFASDEM